MANDEIFWLSHIQKRNQETEVLMGRVPFKPK